jgi:hypothetical protein
MLLSRPSSASSNQTERKRALSEACDPRLKQYHIENLLDNRIDIEGLEYLRRCILAADLSDIIQRIYDLNEKYILQLSAVEGLLRRLNDIKNARRNRQFLKKIKKEFRNSERPQHKIILAEGDSWFNYPVILTDIVDRIAMEKDFAVYSLASGGDWLLNMLAGRQYVEELSVLHPDVFLISGGGNDLVGSSRLAAILEPLGCDEFEHNPWAQQLIAKAKTRTKFLLLDEQAFTEGVRYLNKDFFAVLMFFHLQYYYLISNILKQPKFAGIRVLTQGYDYAIPSYNKGGWNPMYWYRRFIRMFLGHGVWLKTPMLMRGITSSQRQQHILYAIIYLFNEMMIEMGTLLNSEQGRSAVSHIDSRGSVSEKGWADELHPLPKHFMRTAEVFIQCINGAPSTFDHTFVVAEYSCL